MKFKFCPLCGSKLELRSNYDEGLVPYCNMHKMLYFDLPKPCAVVAVLRDEKVLLLKQSYIYSDSKVLLSGYVGVDETVEETVYREVKEEAGIEIDSIEYLGSCYVEGKELLMLTYVARYRSGEINKSSEVEGIDWVKLQDAIKELNKDEIGKTVMRKILEKKGDMAIYPFKRIETEIEQV